MTWKLLHEENGEKTYILVFETGDEVSDGLLDFAKHQRISAARFTAIGALRELTLGYFDWERKEYLKTPVHEQVEVLSLVGNLVTSKDGPKLHAHVVVGKRDGTAHGGHLIHAIVRPTLEVMLTQSPRHLARQHDDATGLPLIKL